MRILSAMFYHVREVKAAGLDAAGHVTSIVRRRERDDHRRRRWCTPCSLYCERPACPIQRMDPFTMKMAFPTAVNVIKIIFFIFQI